LRNIRTGPRADEPRGKVIARTADSGPSAEDERPYGQLVNALTDHAVFRLDDKGRIASWSPGAEQMTGFAAGDVIGEPSSCLYPSEDMAAGKHAAVLHVAALHGKVQDDGWRLRKDGSRFWAEVVIAAIVDSSGTLVGYAEVARDGTERMHLEEDLADAHDRMRALAARHAEVAEQEKMRLSREIHDVLGQELAGLKLDLSWLARRSALVPDPLRQPLLQRLATMAAQIDGCVQTVRRIATGLRPGVLDDLGLDEAIEWQAHEFQARAGIRVELSLPESGLELDRDRATAIFRIFQELITNVGRHSGATGVSVQLTPEAGVVVLEVSDNGRGITADELAMPNALGLLGMRERAAQFGGSLEIKGTKGRGTRAIVRIPVRSPVRNLARTPV
jgi:PAS domain S-box-containing protein